MTDIRGLMFSGIISRPYWAIYHFFMLLIHLYVIEVHDVNTDDPESVRHMWMLCFFPTENVIISQYHRLDTFFLPFSGCANVSDGSRHNLSRTLVGHCFFLLYTVLKVKLKLIGQWRHGESEVARFYGIKATSIELFFCASPHESWSMPIKTDHHLKYHVIIADVAH